MRFYVTVRYEVETPIIGTTVEAITDLIENDAQGSTSGFLFIPLDVPDVEVEDEGDNPE